LTLFAKLGVLTTAALLLAGVAVAQHGGGGHGGGMGGMGGGGMGGGMGSPSAASIPRAHGAPPPNSGGGVVSTNRGGLQLGPPGRWWDDKKFAKTLGLNGDQQKRMDSVFAQNRDALLNKYDTLQKAETRLEGLTHADHLDEGALFTEIDHVAQARADLEKANTRMLLQLRNEMTPDQIGKLEDHR
jgi:Spy/CpxP family protein refolding chaperone